MIPPDNKSPRTQLALGGPSLAGALFGHPSHRAELLVFDSRARYRLFVVVEPVRRNTLKSKWAGPI